MRALNVPSAPRCLVMQSSLDRARHRHVQVVNRPRSLNGRVRPRVQPEKHCRSTLKSRYLRMAGAAGQCQKRTIASRGQTARIEQCLCRSNRPREIGGSRRAIQQRAPGSGSFVPHAFDQGRQRTEIQRGFLFNAVAARQLRGVPATPQRLDQRGTGD
jgi:hypothetical protein